MVGGYWEGWVWGEVGRWLLVDEMGRTNQGRVEKGETTEWLVCEFVRPGRVTELKHFLYMG
jgi:hypothetical protein